MVAIQRALARVRLFVIKSRRDEGDPRFKTHTAHRRAPRGVAKEDWLARLATAKTSRSKSRYAHIHKPKSYPNK